MSLIQGIAFPISISRSTISKSIRKKNPRISKCVCKL